MKIFNVMKSPSILKIVACFAFGLLITLCIICVSTRDRSIASEIEADEQSDRVTAFGEFPPPILSMRREILPPDTLLSRKIFWEEYQKRYPQSGRALLEMGKAMRYLGEKMGDVKDTFSRAVQLEPDNAEALYYLGLIMSCKHNSPEYEKGVSLVEKAQEMDETFPDPYYALWVHYLKAEKYKMADRQLYQLFKLKDIPSPLLDYAHNMLISVDKDGILFTNGDNDTYPPVLLQIIQKIRPDVTIVNQSLLHTTWYTSYLRDRYGTLPIRYNDEELEKLMEDKRGKEYGKSLFLHIIEEAAKEDRPVFFAITLAHMRGQENHLALEGLVYRWSQEERPDPTEEIPIAVTQCEENLYNRYRMDSITDWFFDWSKYPAVSRLMTNYIALYGKLAHIYCTEGQIEKCREAISRALQICDSTGQEEFKKGIESIKDELQLEN
jgi:tetratricopeptide (TPR) repeat protein